MSPFWLLLSCAIAMVAVQDAVPGVALYQYGWYNALLGALVAVAGFSRRNESRFSPPALFGAALVAIAGIASGLLGPETQTIVGAPGTTVQNADFGAFAFPLDARAVRGRRYGLNSIVWPQPRSVVQVDVTDARGGHLTITQPTNASFLSPVLLMQATTVIANMSVHYDTFSVPAAGRNVKAVLFSPAQAAQLTANPPIRGAAVLFAVSDSKDNALRNGIALVASGAHREIGGIVFAPSVREFPALVAASAPNVVLLVIGLAIFAGAAARSWSRSKT